MQHSTNELYVETDRVSRLEERMKKVRLILQILSSHDNWLISEKAKLCDF